MATKVEWTDRAITNLNNIYDFIALDSETYANRFVKALIKSTEKQLSVFPYSGRYIPEFENTPLCFLKEVLFKGYRIIYNPDQAPEKVNIVTVISGRMDLLRNTEYDWVL